MAETENINKSKQTPKYPLTGEWLHCSILI